MEIKHKLGDVAKQLNVPNKKIADLLAELGEQNAKHTTVLGEKEMNYVMDRLTAQNSEKDLDAYLGNAPKPKPKPNEVLKRADGSVVEIPQKKPRKKPQASNSSGQSQQPVVLKRETVTVTVDTRSVDVNLDKFNEKYNDLAATRQVENRK